MRLLMFFLFPLYSWAQIEVDSIMRDFQKAGEPFDAISNVACILEGAQPVLIFAATSQSLNGSWNSNIYRSSSPFMQSRDSISTLDLDQRFINISQLFRLPNGDFTGLGGIISNPNILFVDSSFLITFDKDLQVKSNSIFANAPNQASTGLCPAAVDKNGSLVQCVYSADSWPYSFQDLYVVATKHSNSGIPIIRTRIGLSPGKIGALVPFSDSTYAFLVAGKVAVSDTAFLPQYIFSTQDVTNEACDNVKGSLVEGNGAVITAMACDKVYLNNNGSTSKYRFDKLCKVAAPNLSHTIIDIPVPYDSTWTTLFFRETLADDKDRFYFGNNYTRIFPPYSNQFSVHAVNKTGGLSYSRYYSISNRNMFAKQFVALGDGKLMVVIEEGFYNAQNQYDQNYYYIVLDTEGTLSIDEGSPDMSDLVEEVQVYPNPVSSLLHLPFGLPSSGLFRIFNTGGHEVLFGNCSLEPIDVTSLSEGFYILTVTDKSGSVKYFSKFLKS